METFTSLLVAMVALLTGTSAALSQPLTEEQARSTIAPWYSLFNVATRDDVSDSIRPMNRLHPKTRLSSSSTIRSAS